MDEANKKLDAITLESNAVVDAILESTDDLEAQEVALVAKVITAGAELAAIES